MVPDGGSAARIHCTIFPSRTSSVVAARTFVPSGYSHSSLNATRRMRYGHFVWHLFVLAGTACHVVAVGFYAA